MSPVAAYARKVLAAVVRDCGPPPLPVKFRVVPMQLFVGSCVKRTGHFLIELAPNLTHTELKDTIVHELAHAYAHHGLNDEYRDDHDATWGVAYARVYCAAYETH